MNCLAVHVFVYERARVSMYVCVYLCVSAYFVLYGHVCDMTNCSARIKYNCRVLSKTVLLLHDFIYIYEANECHHCFILIQISIQLPKSYACVMCVCM